MALSVRDLMGFWSFRRGWGRYVNFTVKPIPTSHALVAVLAGPVESAVVAARPAPALRACTLLLILISGGWGGLLGAAA